MQWSKLNRLPMPEWLSNERRGEAEQFNAEINELLRRRQELESARHQIQRANVDELDPDIIGDAGTLRERFTVVRDERALRLRIDEWVASFAGEWRQELQASRAAIDDAQQRVRKKLVKVGYVDTGDRRNNYVMGSIAPDMVQAHPDVRAARERYKGLQRNPFSEYRRQNRAAIQWLDAQLESIRDRATIV